MADPIVIDVPLRSTLTVLGEVFDERLKQEAKWGEQNHPNGTSARHPGPIELLGTIKAELATLPSYTAMQAKQLAANIAKGITDAHAKSGDLTYADILLEEVFEALAESESEPLRKELVQVAAVAVAWVECIDRRTPRIYTGGGREVTVEQAAKMMTAHLRDPRVDPQAGDVISLPPREGFLSIPIYVVHRRPELVYVATPQRGISTVWLRDFQMQCVSAVVVEDEDLAWPLPRPEMARG